MAATYSELLKMGTEKLYDTGAADAPIDAEWLLSAVTGKTKSFLFLHGNKECPAEQTAQYLHFIDRRRRGEPVQYIIGFQEFMGLSFEVSPAVLIPRQDTEILVESALEEASSLGSSARILDLCCGSGAIAVSIAYYLPGMKVTAADISADALKVAGRNAENNGVSDRITFLRTDMFFLMDEKENPSGFGRFDMILCNPPYIPTETIPSLQKEITEHEPVNALDGGPDGLRFYRILADESWKYMSDEGILMMEIGFDQADVVCSLFNKDGHYIDITVIRDLAGKDRVIRCRKRV